MPQDGQGQGHWVCGIRLCCSSRHWAITKNPGRAKRFRTGSGSAIQPSKTIGLPISSVKRPESDSSPTRLTVDLTRQPASRNSLATDSRSMRAVWIVQWKLQSAEIRSVCILNPAVRVAARTRRPRVALRPTHWPRVVRALCRSRHPAGFRPCPEHGGKCVRIP